MRWKTDTVRITDGIVFVDRAIEVNAQGIGTYKVVAAISLEDIKRIAKAIAEEQKNDL